MYGNRIFRWVVFSLVLVVFGADSRALLREESTVCMGVRILTEEQAAAYTEYQTKDLSDILLYNGEPAAVDTGTATVYLSQDIRESSRPKDLPGKLILSDKNYTLYFAPDSHFSDLAAAAEEGHSFTLLAVSGEKTCVKYNVIFTTLPVLRLDGTFSHLDEEEREVQDGSLCLWTPNDPETGRYSAKSSGVQWHIRGGGTSAMDKNSWKLSLKDALGEINDLDFLGMGSDDDWILNSMVMDDTKQREILFQQLWNEWADQGVWNNKMSVGEYVEVVCNDSYSGIYLLQRRIDRKYYRLHEDDILLKGINWWTTENLEEAYEIVYSPLGTQETLALMDGVLQRYDCSMLQLDNFLDVSLFLQFACAADNDGVKNMFYLLRRQEDSYTLIMIPWDTDLSWGVLWTNQYDYSYDRAMGMTSQRREYDAMKARFPEIRTLMSVRWEELRSSVLSTEHVLEVLHKDQAMLVKSGALQRDTKRWGQMFNGEDTTENLFRFVEERLLRLDSTYLK